LHDNLQRESQALRLSYPSHVIAATT